jgi:DNA-binding NtrC family response regulator
VSRLLLVDDDPGNRRILESRLAEGGHEVVTGENGALGLALARESRFDLVLLSSELRSGVDAFEVSRRVKALPETARPGILLYCEQLPVPELLERGYQAGCDAFVTRPDLPALEAILGNLLRQRARIAETEEELGRLREQLRRGGQARPAAGPAATSHKEAPKEAVDRAVALRELACERPDGLLLVDSEGTVRHADRGACEMLGGSLEGRHLGNLAPASGLEAFVRDARLEPREGFRFDLAPRKGHAVRSLSATVVPLVVQPGQHDPEMRVVLVHDAARRRLAAEVLHMQEPGIPRQEHGPLVEAARETFTPSAMVGDSAATSALRAALAEWSRLTAPVLLHGEAGTGKERAARILHYSGQATGAFVQIRCGALTAEGLELELFGRVRGSSPDAVHDRPGLFHLAHDGTLYLADVGDAPPETQRKLLEFLESGVVTRLGSRKSERARVRLIASTRDPLEGRVREGRFSRELLQRLDGVSATLPQLSERLEDVAPIARHCLSIFGFRRGVSAIADEVLAVLARHVWPRNVAELVDCMQHACARANGDMVTVEDLPDVFHELRRAAGDRDLIPSAPPGRGALAGTHSVSLPEKEIARVPSRPGRETRPWDITDEDPISLELYEKKALLRALDSVGGDRLAAARLLNVGKSTLYRKLKQFGIG